MWDPTLCLGTGLPKPNPTTRKSSLHFSIFVRRGGGNKGDTGPPGDRGPPGPQGGNGRVGDEGPDGATGDEGEAGTSRFKVIMATIG